MSSSHSPPSPRRTHAHQLVSVTRDILEHYNAPLKSLSKGFRPVITPKEVEVCRSSLSAPSAAIGDRKDDRKDKIEMIGSGFVHGQGSVPLQELR